MKIQSIKISNLYSFKYYENFEEAAEIVFNDKLNILVGPNGSGKSNLLDILNTVLHKYFYIPWEKLEVKFAAININSELIKNFNFLNEDSKIEIKFKIEKEDIENIKILLNKENDFSRLLKKTGSTPNPDRFFENLKNKKDELFLISELEYNIVNNNIVDLKENSINKTFLLYLQNYFLFYYLTLEDDYEGEKLNITNLYFSPYRKLSSLQTSIGLNRSSFIGQWIPCQRNKITSKQGDNISSRQGESEYLHTALYYLADRWARNKINIHDEIKSINELLKEFNYSFTYTQLDAIAHEYQPSFKIKERAIAKNNELGSGEKEILHIIFSLIVLASKNSLVIIDEPELHIHPPMQKRILEFFQKLAFEKNIQLILITHSPTFINYEVMSSITRFYINEEGSTSFKKLENTDNYKKTITLINIYHNEKMFFADKIILVEGIGDRVFWETLIQREQLQETIEVLDVGGKHNFEEYQKILNDMGVQYLVIADLDYIDEIGDEALRKLFKFDQKRCGKEIKQKNSKDGKQLCEDIEEAINNNCITEGLKDTFSYLKSRFIDLDRKNLTQDDCSKLDEFIEKKYKENLFIFKFGDLEYYLKEIKVNTFLTNSKADPEKIKEYFDNNKEVEIKNSELNLILDNIINNKKK